MGHAPKCRAWIFLIVTGIALAGCGGIRMRSEANTPGATQPLLETSDVTIAVAIDTVVVRNGPGAWVTDAQWDEYRLRVRSQARHDLRLVSIRLVDALGNGVDSSADRGVLVDGTREVEARYATSGKMARDTSGAWVAVVGGAAVTAVGAGTAAALVATPFVASAGTAAAGAAVVAGGVFIVGAGVLMAANYLEVSAQVSERQTPLPAEIGREDIALVAFFPVVPLPSAIELSYRDGASERTSRFALQPALARVHVPPAVRIVKRPEPAFPTEASRMGIPEGFVKASLYVDAQGKVRSVEVLQSSAPEFISEAVRTFRHYQYSAGWEDRTIEETMPFRRP